MYNYNVALTGKAFNYMANKMKDEENKAIKSMYKAVIKHSKIFARMSPDDKAQLIIELQQNTQFMVGMCGDGANDCKALKTADVGLSLSEAEASIAAPFTSKITNISPMITLLKEGRCSLATSFQVFKYMALYSMIQFTTVLILYQFIADLSPYEYLYEDLFITTPLVFTMSLTGPYHKLDKALPLGKLWGVPVLISVLGHIVIQAAAQIIMYYILASQSWYVKNNPEWEICWDSTESTVLWFVSLMMFICIALSYSVGRPFRKEMWRNPIYFGLIIIITIINVLLIFVNLILLIHIDNASKTERNIRISITTRKFQRNNNGSFNSLLRICIPLWIHTQYGAELHFQEI